MADKVTLLALADRVQAAERPDRELECMVWCATGLSGVPFRGAKAVVPDYGEWIAPAYTGSIDAAMKLVPEGWVATITVYHDCATATLADDRVHPVRLDNVEVDADTAPHALTAAALRALASQEQPA